MPNTLIIITTLVMQIALFIALFQWFRILKLHSEALAEYSRATDERTEALNELDKKLMARARVLDCELAKLQDYDLRLKAYRDDLAKSLAVKYFSRN